MTIAEFSITPIGKGVSVGEYVARSVDIVDRSGLPYRLNPMGTVIEGSFDEILALIARCHKAVMEDCERVSTIVKDRRPQGRVEAARGESRGSGAAPRPKAQDLAGAFHRERPI